jgi:mono/diheme cytochrome c family protein
VGLGRAGFGKSRYRFWLIAFVLLIPLAGATLWFGGWLTPPRPGDPSDQEQVALGWGLYQRDCARCHGHDLAGEFGWLEKEVDLSDEALQRAVAVLEDSAPAHDASGNTSRHSDETLFAIIKLGPQEALNLQHGRMPSFEHDLSDDEIWVVIAFLKTYWPEHRPPS